MSYIKFERDELVNLESALSKELIRSNRAGSYASSTIIGCNTSKYHGLLIVPFDDGSKHVLLSEIEETVIQRGESFRLGIRKYQGGKYDPHGHKYIREFNTEPIPGKTYRVGGIVLKKEQLLSQNEERIMIRYTILEADAPATLRLRPFLAFRHIHALSKVNMDVNTKTQAVDNGVKACLYDNYPELFMQISKKNTYVQAPDWFKDIEYQKDKERGYEHTEDLLVPGFFDIKVKKDDVIIFSAGLSETNTRSLKRKFDSALKSRIPRNSFENCLTNSAQQFFVHNEKNTLLSVGYHWYDFRYREALISLAGLTLPTGDTDTFLKTFDTLIKMYLSDKSCFEPDIPLMFFWLIQQYEKHSGDDKQTWTKYR